jgi:glyoxylase-like metal-dependent hydrolase (beta-lactamase superfamily II)
MAAYFRQFRDPATEAFSYLIGCARVGKAVIIDPVLGQVPLYLGVLKELALSLAWSLDTHLHADHVTAADALRARTGARVGAGAGSGIDNANRLLADGDSLAVGEIEIETVSTPGHTQDCLTFRWTDRLFTGDCLLIGGCGRIDEPGGNGAALFDSVTRRLFSLADETLVYPGHGSQQRWVSCIGEERESNPMFHGISRDRFTAMKTAEWLRRLDTMPLMIEANRHCGRFGGDPRANSESDSCV